MFAYFTYNFMLFTIIVGLTSIINNIYEVGFDYEFNQLKISYEFKLDRVCYYICKTAIILTFACSLTVAVASALGMILIVIASFL